MEWAHSLLFLRQKLKNQNWMFNVSIYLERTWYNAAFSCVGWCDRWFRQCRRATHKIKLFRHSMHNFLKCYRLCIMCDGAKVLRIKFDRVDVLRLLFDNTYISQKQDCSVGVLSCFCLTWSVCVLYRFKVGPVLEMTRSFQWQGLSAIYNVWQWFVTKRNE